jgi:hypothetical protein
MTSRACSSVKFGLTTRFAASEAYSFSLAIFSVPIGIPLGSDIAIARYMKRGENLGPSKGF